MTQSMHILYLASVLPKRSETFVYREVLGLRERGVNVSVASVHQPERDLGDPTLDALAAEAVTVYPDGLAAVLRDARAGLGSHAARRGLGLALGERGVPLKYRPKIIAQVLGGLALAERFRDQGVTHIHAHMAHVPTTIAMIAADALGVGFSFTGHAADLFRDRMLLETKLQRADFIACISNWHHDFYQRVQPGLDPAKLPVIRCGVDVPPDQDSTPPGVQGGATLTQADNTADPLILGVGRLVPKKGFDVLLEAMAGTQTRVVIAGDGPMRQRLTSLATPSTELVGALSHREAVELINRADVFALPCREDERGDKDGIPVVLMEAMARGICVVSGDLPTIRELVADSETGRLVASGEAEELRRVLQELLDDPDQRRRLGSAGRQRVEQEFSSEVNLSRLIAEFERAQQSRV